MVAQGTLIHPPVAALSITMVKRARSKDEVATNQIVKLNVGGRKFHVGKQTLDAFGYMRARLNDGFPLKQRCVVPPGPGEGRNCCRERL